MKREKPMPKPAAKSAATKPAPRSAHPSGIDAGLVREIAAMMDRTDLTEIEVSKGDLHIRVARQHAPAAAPTMHAATAPQYAAAPVVAPPPVTAARAP